MNDSAYRWTSKLGRTGGVLILIGIFLLGPMACGRSPETDHPPVPQKVEDGANPYEPGSLVGESVLDYPDTGLVNQSNKPVSFRSLVGEPTVVSFIYTRCPMPKMCPLITYRMRQAQVKIGKREDLSARFVLATFDPSYDTPSVLREYGTKRNIDFQNFDLWTGPPKTVHQMVRKFKVITRESHQHADTDAKAPVITHNLRTYILDSEGTVRFWYRGNEWKPRHIVARVAQLTHEQVPDS